MNKLAEIVAGIGMFILMIGLFFVTYILPLGLAIAVGIWISGKLF